MASVAALTELAALWPGDVVVVDDVLAPPSLRTIIDDLDFAYWWPTEIGWRQASGAFNVASALVGAARARAKSGSAKSFVAAAAHRLSGGRTDICPPAVGIFGSPKRNRSPNARTRTSQHAPLPAN